MTHRRKAAAMDTSAEVGRAALGLLAAVVTVVGGVLLAVSAVFCLLLLVVAAVGLSRVLCSNQAAAS
jgi:hypothetical protein